MIKNIPCFDAEIRAFLSLEIQPWLAERGKALRYHRQWLDMSLIFA